MRFTEPAPTRNLLSPCRNTLSRAAESDISIVPQATQTRKRPCPSTGPVTLSNDAATSKRPCRAIKESRKAREVREAREAREAFDGEKASAPSDFLSKKRGIRTRLSYKGDGDYGRVVDLENVYLGENGSIQCVVRWRPSLITQKNLGSRILNQIPSLLTPVL
jgi:hypothetical protein